MRLHRKKIIIWGASGHAMVVADIIRLRGDYEIVGFLDDVNRGRQKQDFLGSSILGGREQLDALRKEGVDHLILGFGDCDARLKISDLARSKGFTLARAIHPNVIISGDVRVGDGTVIVAGAVVNPGARIGENVIINTSASVDHECVIEDGVHIGPGAHLGCRVIVGSAAWVGIGAVLRDRISIGSRSIIGAGAVVLRDVPDEVVAYGVPARVIRKREL